MSVINYKIARPPSDEAAGRLALLLAKPWGQGQNFANALEFLLTLLNSGVKLNVWFNTIMRKASISTERWIVRVYRNALVTTIG